MDSNTVKSYFENLNVVADYAKAVDQVKLWNSEAIIFSKYIKTTDTILELGCGAGRIGINLARNGYTNIKITDFSENMVAIAKMIAERDALNISAEVCDATKIPYLENTFDAVIFGFNGLMQIPRKDCRITALKHIRRILKDDGIFIFTTHDRDVSEHKDYWSSEKKQWEHGVQDPRLDEFGDIFYKGDHGNIFIHSPSKDEIVQSLSEANLELIYSERRSAIADEPACVSDFSDDCIFWITKKTIRTT